MDPKHCQMERCAMKAAETRHDARVRRLRSTFQAQLNIFEVALTGSPLIIANYYGSQVELKNHSILLDRV